MVTLFDIVRSSLGFKTSSMLFILQKKMINFTNNYFKFLKDVVEIIAISLKNLENISKL